MKKFNLKQKWNTIDKLFKNMDEDHVSEYSAQCSYYMILSFIPFIILLLTMVQYTTVDQHTLLEAISKIIPTSMNEFVINIIREVYSKSLGTISISIIFTLWSAGKGLYALTKGLQSIYKVDPEEKINLIYVRFKSIIETIVFIILLTVGLTLLVFGKSFSSIIQNYFGSLNNYKIILEVLTELRFYYCYFYCFLVII